MLKIISQNPYRVLGVLSNSPLKERVGNQNRLAAFAKVGKEVSFPNDFAPIIPEKPIRTSDSISSANVALNLDKDQLKHALVWFINGSPIDDIAIKHIQAGNLGKARELFEKKETFSSLINVGVLNLISGNYTSGFSNISMVIHNNEHRSALLKALGIENLTMTEDEIAIMFIEEILSEVPASTLLAAASNPNDKALIGKTALDEPISAINAAVAAAKSVNSKDADANLQAGTKLMNSTKAALKQVKDIAGATSPQYQMVADNVAKAVLQCGINYYNNAPDSDVESPRKAMVLQAYALKIAVGQLTKRRCKENHDILKKAVDNMPPAEVAIEARKVKDELRKFCNLPDKIEYSINLLNATKPLLQRIKSKLGSTNSFYLSLSTQVVGNALHNLIEEVNQAQNYLSAIVEAAKKAGLDPAMLNYLGDEHSPAKIIDNKLKPVLRQAWKATTIMDTFDMESDFKVNRYNANRKSLKEMCDNLGISPPESQGKWYENGCVFAIIVWLVLGSICGLISLAFDGPFFIGLIFSGILVAAFSGLFE
ncbi:MAG: hypothetical protein NC221_08525 [Duncaniella sp.]|nr:hypothetical protein [Duncaniella sp.]MCM1400939.1 hypothetical protein [Bacteroides sp.]